MSKDRLVQTWVNVDSQRTRLCVAPAAPMNDDISAPPLLLLHGLGCSSAAWRPSLRSLAARAVTFATYAPDFPGCGRSSAVGGAMGMDALGDWTARLLDALEIERAHIAGNSMGCQVALALARRHPERVVSVALLGPTTGSANVPFWRYAVGLLWDAFGESLRYNWVLLGMYLQMGPVRYFATVRKMMEDDPLSHALEVHAPVLVMRGGHDRIVTEEMAQNLTAALPNAQYQPLDSTAHAAEFNTPDLFVSAVLEFLERVEQEKALPHP
jgi:pimeloyl-ACP methyl ester carboxylesterase